MYGATDAGLKDVRDNLFAWPTGKEMERHTALSDMDEHKDKSIREISEILLNERWDLEMRKELYTTVHKCEYDGGDL